MNWHHSFLKSVLLSSALFASINCTPAKAETPAPQTPSCVLRSFGDCCQVTLGSNQDAAVQTAITTGSMVDFLVIKDGGENECDFQFDGDMSVSMHARHHGFNGTWIGGNSVLHYISDTSSKGSCQLTLYYMNIAHVGHFPHACVGNKAQIDNPF